MSKQKKVSQYRNDEYLKILGEHCRKLREKKGYSVNRLAREGERLSPSVVMRLESGEGAITVSSLIRYAQVLEIHPKKLLDFSFDLDE
jgi:transcriptional regulator with XRE-family HTH domain